MVDFRIILTRCIGEVRNLAYRVGGKMSVYFFGLPRLAPFRGGGERRCARRLRF